MLWKVFKILEITEVIRQRADCQLINLLNNVPTGDVPSDDVNILKLRVLPDKRDAEDYPPHALHISTASSLKKQLPIYASTFHKIKFIKC